MLENPRERYETNQGDSGALAPPAASAITMMPMPMMESILVGFSSIVSNQMDSMRRVLLRDGKSTRNQVRSLGTEMNARFDALESKLEAAGNEFVDEIRLLLEKQPVDTGAEEEEEEKGQWLRQD
eukprot:GABV01012637.1.p1 GENE.GABV01012637.1~~GABV01012637.1.p1  ORF type:complete len:134 (+),score=53.12 GABV01012637.1:28-402(+)